MRRHLINSSFYTRSQRSTLILAGVLASLASVPALAQEDDAVQERVIVTGSRIVIPNLESTSPVTTVGSQDFALSNTLNAERFLNALPQTIPGFDASSNNPGTGEATVDLRGLGTARTLVLVNGRRYISSSQSGGVDLNTIPVPLIGKVDILTGGASAVYGSDAMAGVVNFVLRDSFEGVQADVAYEISERGDGGTLNMSSTIGGNFSGDRGNAVLSVDYARRDSVLQGSRNFSLWDQVDRGVAGGLQNSGSANVPSTSVIFQDPMFLPDYTAAGVAQPPCTGFEGVIALSQDQTFCTRAENSGIAFIFNPSGPGIIPWVNSGDNTTRYNYAPINYLQIPQERYSVYGAARYDISENIQAYGRAIFVSSQTEQLLAPTPAGAVLTINLDNPFIQGDSAVLSLLTQISQAQANPDSDGNGVNDAVIRGNYRFLSLGGRLSDYRFDQFQISGGLKGSIADRWFWELYGSVGQSQASIRQTNNVSLSAWQEQVRLGNANLFEENALSEEVRQAIRVDGLVIGTTETRNLSFDASGELGRFIPSAETPVSVAVGGEYRFESLVTQGAGLGPDIRGFNTAPTTNGNYSVTEFFAEAVVPLVENMPLIEELSLNGAYRFSNYSTAGNVLSYAAGAGWVPTSNIRFRGQYQRAVRAPNIGELFQPLVNGFPSIMDPCSSGAGRFDDLDPSVVATVTAQCISNGVPEALVGANIQPNSQIEGLFGGNPNLKEETADTYTIGVVYDNDNIADGFVASLDYYNVTITDTISTIPNQTLLNLCFEDSMDQYCSQITRLQNGTIEIFRNTSSNIGELKAEGFDLSLDITSDIGNSSINLYSLIGWKLRSSVQPIKDLGTIEHCKGYYGAICGGPTPEFVANTRVDWSFEQYTLRMRWRYFSATTDDQLRDGAQADLSVRSIPDYHKFDATLYWNLREDILLTLGITNLLDVQPPILGNGSSEQSNTFPSYYDTIGRTFFARVGVTF